MSTPRQLREAFASCPWNYSQASLCVKQVRDNCREAWEWLTPRVREALIAEKALSVVLASYRDDVPVFAMKQLHAAMRVAAGLATLEEVT